MLIEYIMAVHFRDLMFEIRDEVYVPDDDSFFLANSMNVKPGSRVLDVGTGCGFLAISSSQLAVSVVGVDINHFAIELAKYNANLNRIDNVDFFVSDLFENVSGKFDLVLFNSPYLPVNDDGILAKAWSGGETGVGVIVRFVENVGDFLEDNGVVLILASSLTDQERLEKLFGENDFDFEMVGSKDLFFEKLLLFQLTKKS